MSNSQSDTCTIHNVRLDHHFTITRNSTWEDVRLSFKAKGVLIYILSRPPNWSIHTWQLAKLYQGEDRGNGIDSIKAVMKELRDLGYVVYSKKKDAKGFWIHRYDTYPVPYEDFIKLYPQVAKPPLDEPPAVKPPVIINTELTSNDLNYTSKEDIAQTAKKRLRYEFSFSFENSKFEGIEQKDLDSWMDLYPSVDIPREIKLMEQWCIANPKKSKSKKKWRQFINTWLASTNEKNINKEVYKANSGNMKKDQNKSEPNREGVWVNGVKIK